MKTVELNLKNNGENVKVHLRLTAGGQLRLKEKYEEENTISTLMDAINNIDKTIAVFEESLNYKNNDNTITDGEELYDLLVDNGRTGIADFAKVITDIAVASGIINKPQANSLVKNIGKTYDDIFKEIENTLADGEDTLEKEENEKITPTK